MTLNATARIKAAKDDAPQDSWWDSLEPEQQKGYIEQHPNSKYARRSRGEDEETGKPKPKKYEEDKPTKLKQREEEVRKQGADGEEEEVAPKDTGEDEEKPKKSDKDLKKKAHKAYEKLGLKKSSAEQTGTDRDVKYVSTEGYANSGEKGSSKHGFWIGPDTWLSMTKKEYNAMSDQDIKDLEEHGERLEKKDRKGKDKDLKKFKKEQGRDFKGLEKPKKPKDKLEKKLKDIDKKGKKKERKDKLAKLEPKAIKKATDQVIKNGGAKPGSKDRNALSEHVADNVDSLSKGLWRGSKDAVRTTALGLSLLTRKGRNRDWSDEEKRAARHTALRAAAIIGTSVAAGTGLGTAALMYAAVKWMALPMLKRLFIGAAKRMDKGSGNAWASVTAADAKEENKLAASKALMEELAEYIKSGDLPMEAITEFA